MQESKSSAILSPETLKTLSTPLSVLCFLFFYLSLASFIFATLETILGIVKKDDQSASWWRRSRLVALTYAQMYLSQHFLRIVTSGKPGADELEKSFWMASQTIAAGVVMFSVVKLQNTTERLLIGQCYKLERPQLAQMVLTLIVSFNIHLVAGPLAAALTAAALLVSLDWRILILLFEGIASWKASRGNQLADLTWGMLHVVLAVGLIRAVHNFDKQEGQIALSADEESALETVADAKSEGEFDILKPATSLPASRLFIMLCVLTVFAGAVVTTIFFGLEKFLLPGLLESRDAMNAEALVLSRMFTTETIGVLLVALLTARELSRNSIVRCIIAGLT
ncbi:hypothetical protein TWF106_001240 [Orbilia oligospora]|uniref:Uncharacterized protein n=1 Tax=Orbilia oligospora TaxID=2813651 RepID=A0A6G1LX71_ORBOL|nr:hypothetical protein TWF788_007349 [Orbilia oligospora]KAF3211100.1 hypothetical protein TWF679_006591 [Orbilia oligospora]KAF3217410.1 hypothetical protein TWF191_008578 [Orbilia oligospora]KAF3226024.1 hypothetical protein TWF106_001240 [Orbilia oligospora]KAF3237502.1 hypothetical protein TWF192_010858 [Orbilia oligospora]